MRDPQYPEHIRLFQVLYNEKDDSLVFGVAKGEDTERAFKKRYGLIGQHIRGLSDQIQRRQWPHYMADCPWVHVVPVDDLIQHSTGFREYECQCHPRVDTANRRVEHYAMDGRGEWQKEVNSPLWAFIQEGEPNETDAGPDSSQTP